MAWSCYCHCFLSSDTQFALFHDIASIVYRSQHSVLLEEIGNRESAQSTVVPQSNTLEPLLSQLHSQRIKAKTVYRIGDCRTDFFRQLSMYNNEKIKEMECYIPPSDRGVPIVQLHPFLRQSLQKPFSKVRVKCFTCIGV